MKGGFSACASLRALVTKYLVKMCEVFVDGDILYCSWQEGKLRNLPFVKRASCKTALIFGTLLWIYHILKAD